MKKHLISIISIIYLALYLNAGTLEEAGYTITLFADKEGNVYKKSDKAKLSLTASKGAETIPNIDVKWEISHGGAETTKDRPTTKLVDGKSELIVTSDKAGILLCKAYVNLPGMKKSCVVTGVAFDPFEIQPSLPVPDDFDTYWAAQKKILKDIPMNIKIKEITEKVPPNLSTFEVEADTFKGKLYAYISFPKDAKAKSLPVLINAHGAGTRGSNKTTAEHWANLGYLSMDFNAHGLDFGLKPAEYKAFDPDKNKVRKNSHSKDDLFFRELFMRVMRAIDVICEQPQWDGKVLAFIGTSQGGGQAIAAGGLDERVNIVAANVPAICDHAGAVAGRMPGWPTFAALDKEGAYDKKAVEETRYVDGMNFAARITKARTLICVGLCDTACVPEAVYATFNNVKSKNKQIVNYPEASHALPKDAMKVQEDFVIRNTAEIKSDK